MPVFDVDVRATLVGHHHSGRLEAENMRMAVCDVTPLPSIHQNR